MMNKEEIEEFIGIVREDSEKNPFIKIFNIINEELSKEGDLINAKELLKTIEDNTMFDDPTLIAGFLQSNNTRNNRVNISRAFAPVNYI